MVKKLRITMTKSPISAIPKHKLTMKALGLKKMHQTVERTDNPATRGMVNSIIHLVTVEEFEGK